jgi:hypothetical protein
MQSESRECIAYLPSLHIILRYYRVRVGPQLPTSSTIQPPQRIPASRLHVGWEGFSYGRASPEDTASTISRKTPWMLSRLLKKPGRLKSALHGHSYVVDSRCSVGAHACGFPMWRGFFSNLLESHRGSHGDRNGWKGWTLTARIPSAIPLQIEGHSTRQNHGQSHDRT